MRLIAVAACLCLPLVAEAQGEALTTGAWTCLQADGQIAFLLSLGDGVYGTDDGQEGVLESPGPGMITFIGGALDGGVGTQTGGIVALMLADGKVPVICPAP
jgi:hypothetical protein